MTLWKRTDDGWKIHRDLSAPVPPGVSGASAPAAFHVSESEPFRAVVLPMTGPYSRSGEALARVIVELATQQIEPLGPAFGRYYDDESEVPPTELRFEVGFPVAEGTTAATPLEVREIDDGTIVWAVVGGPHEAANRPWPELEAWARTHGYSDDGPAMETWLDGPRTEMRMAVRRVD
jgi:effector-binding domain-containing protein